MILLHRLYARNFKQLSEVSLHFPPQATILIEGHNEAGKSSLFEAVFFALYGQTLTSDRDYKLEDLRSYGADVLEVELEFSIEGRRFFVSRKVGKNHTVKLTCPGENGETETISIRSEVSRRILEELRLSPDALLNTCFVEQKRLERLEDLNAESRRNTINELLNLRVLTHLENQFKVTKDDRESLQRLKGRMEVARLDADLPTLEATVYQAQQCLRYARLLASAACYDKWQQEIIEATQQQEDIKTQRSTIRQNLEEAAQLRTRLDAIDSQLSWRLRAWLDAIELSEQTSSRVQQIEGLRATLPQRERQLHDGELLHKKLACLEELETQADQLLTAQQQKQQQLHRYDEVLHQWQAGAASLQELACKQQQQETVLTEAEARLQAQQTAQQRLGKLALVLQHLRILETIEREVAQANEQLNAARTTAAQLSELSTRLAQLEVEERRLRQYEATRQTLQQVEAALDEATRQQQPTQIISNILLTTNAQREATHDQMKIVTQSTQKALPESELAAALTREQSAAQRVLATLESITHDTEALQQMLLNDNIHELNERLQRLEMEKQRLTQQMEEARDLPDTLQQLGVASDLDSVAGAIQSLRTRIADCQKAEDSLHILTNGHAEKTTQLQHETTHIRMLIEELHITENGASEWAERINSEHAVLQKKIDEPSKISPDHVHQLRTALNDINNRIARLEAEQQQRKGELDALSREALIEETAAIEHSLSSNDTQQEHLKSVRMELQKNDLATKTAALQTQLALLQQNLERDQSQIEELPTMQQVAKQSQESLDVKAAEFAQTWEAALNEAAPVSPNEAQARLQQIRSATQDALAQLHEAELHASDKTLQQQHDDLNDIIITRRHQQKEAQQQQTKLLEELDFAPDEPLDNLPAHLPELAQAKAHSAEEWECVLRQREEAVRDNRSQRRFAAEALGLDEERLHLSEVESALRVAEKNIAVKRRAGEIVSRTRHSIVSRVMPLTMQNMRQLLPLLTDGRYQDVLWDEENNYLAVYDSRAHMFHRKRVFSGGARDQISLALRLAFALATLPGEHNVRPGWLFLDEPLSSFDRTRTQALVELLTRGLVRRHFDQIFLVSHSESFDPAQFDYRLRLDGGRIVESTLPEKVK